jgi:hypothetical protein
MSTLKLGILRPLLRLPRDVIRYRFSVCVALDKVAFTLGIAVSNSKPSLSVAAIEIVRSVGASVEVVCTNNRTDSVRMAVAYRDVCDPVDQAKIPVLYVRATEGVSEGYLSYGDRKYGIWAVERNRRFEEPQEPISRPFLAAVRMCPKVYAIEDLRNCAIEWQKSFLLDFRDYQQTGEG